MTLLSLRARRVGALGLALLLTGLPLRAEDPAASSDADARIRFYQARLGGAGTYPAYARLGAAYLQKARETGQQRYLDEAVDRLETSLRFQRNYEALLWMATARLARHEFPEALAYAQEAVDTLPGDLAAQGALFDAHLARGDLQQAKALADKMFSLDPGFASYARRAALRDYRGDVTGALEALQAACALPEAEAGPRETRAWCQVRLGSLYLARCEPERAEAAYQRALAFFPDYFRALEHAAELRAAQERAAEAIRLYRQLLRKTADLAYQLALADLLAQQGETRAARRERQRALAGMRRSAQNGSRVYLRPLALLLLEEKETAAEGLRWAQADWENRRDVWAADTLAWALRKNGRHPEALAAVEEALRPGLKDAGILLHAARIHQSAGQPPAARAFLEQALACPGGLPPAERARAEKLLAELRATEP